jgi:hypothetical protein
MIQMALLAADLAGQRRMRGEAKAAPPGTQSSAPRGNEKNTYSWELTKIRREIEAWRTMALAKSSDQKYGFIFASGIARLWEGV